MAIWATCCSLRVGMSRPTTPAPRTILSGRARASAPGPGRLSHRACDRKPQGEGRALTVPGLEGRAAAVTLEDRADQRETEPGPVDAAGFAGAAQLLPHRLELVGGDAAPGVRDLEQDHPLLLAAADLDRVLARGVLHRVAECVPGSRRPSSRTRWRPRSTVT